MDESLGRRLAHLRAAQGFTQQTLADRMGLSRVAISHFESDLAIPSERTVILLAGLLRVEPHALVANTFYPAGKALRLPPVAPRYTEVQLQLALLEHDLARLELPPTTATLAATWRERLLTLEAASADPHEQTLLKAALARLARFHPDQRT